jgi:hypothetical protein
MKKVVLQKGSTMLAIIACLLLSSCAYSVPMTISPAVNVYSGYDDKIPGTVVLVMDDSLRNIHDDIAPTSYFCSAHKFPIIMGTALTASIEETTSALFENVAEENNLPTQRELMGLNARGTVFVRLKRFSAKIRFSQGFWSSSADASSELVLDVTVRDVNNRSLMVTSVGGERSADGDAGSYCKNGANVLSDSISKTIEDTMERYAERISNSEKIRTAFRNNKNNFIKSAPALPQSKKNIGTDDELERSGVKLENGH